MTDEQYRRLQLLRAVSLVLAVVSMIVSVVALFIIIIGPR